MATGTDKLINHADGERMAAALETIAGAQVAPEITVVEENDVVTITAFDTVNGTTTVTITDHVPAHAALAVASETGVHGLRYYDEKLEKYNDETKEWDEIETGNGSALIIIKTQKSELFSKTVNVTDWMFTYLGTFDEGVDGVATTQVKVKYIGNYTATCDGVTVGSVNVTELGAIYYIQGIVYGFHINGSESDPTSAVTYLEDAVGMTPAYMDYSAGKFNYGDWEGAFFMPKPCMLKYDGTVDYYLDPNDHTKKEDGTASDITSDSYGGNAMVEWGQNGQIIWYKIVPDSGDSNSCSVYISNNQMDEDYHAWSFYDCKGNLGEHFYTPMYFGSNVSNRLRSLSGKSGMVSQTAPTEITYAKANNTTSDVIWYTEVVADRILIQLLLVLMSKSLDSQTKFGKGRCASGNTSAIANGTMNTKGMFWGSTDQTSGVKVFFMENWWGNLWRRTAGWVNANGTQKFKLTYDTTDGSTASAYNTDGSGYLTISGATPAGTNGGYINKMLFTSRGIAAPYQASGSETTYFTDGLWFNNSQNNYAFCGGHWSDAGLVGAFCANLNNAPSNSCANVGAALSCKPLAA